MASLRTIALGTLQGLPSELSMNALKGKHIRVVFCQVVTYTFEFTGAAVADTLRIFFGLNYFLVEVGCLWL